MRGPVNTVTNLRFLQKANSYFAVE